MPIELDKILESIAKEKAIHPHYPGASTQEKDDAWARVAKANKIRAHEAMSIFKVLQKKYGQEKLKASSSWKLFNIMEKIYKIEEETMSVKDENSDHSMDEDEQYEMLEVQEDDDSPVTGLTTTGSDGESPAKSVKSEKSDKSEKSLNSPEKVEKEASAKTSGKEGRRSSGSNNFKSSNSITTSTTAEERKVLNPILSLGSKISTITPGGSAAAALQKKGIIVKKTTSGTPSSGGTNPSGSVSILKPQCTAAANSAPVTIKNRGGKTIQLPESIKRKLTEEQQQQQSGHVTKKVNTGPKTSTAPATQTSPQTTHTTTAQLLKVKQDQQEQQDEPNGISVITIPTGSCAAGVTSTSATTAARSDLNNGLVNVSRVGIGATSSTAATIASTSTNGFSPRMEEIDFKNEIIFDAGGIGFNDTSSAPKANAANSGNIINLGNFDNSLPPTFFKNLCNSSRHEALGLYVANVMNRMNQRSAAKLEMAILRAIIDVQSDELDTNY